METSQASSVSKIHLFLTELAKRLASPDFDCCRVTVPDRAAQEALIKEGGGFPGFVRDVCPKLAARIVPNDVRLEKNLRAALELLCEETETGCQFAWRLYSDVEEYLADFIPKSKPLTSPVYKVLSAFGYDGPVKDIDDCINTSVTLESTVTTFERYLKTPQNSDVLEGIRVVYLALKRRVGAALFTIPGFTEREPKNEEAVNVLMFLLRHLHRDETLFIKEKIIRRRYFELKPWELNALNLDIQYLIKFRPEALRMSLHGLSLKYIIPFPAILKLYLNYQCRDKIQNHPDANDSAWARELYGHFTAGEGPMLFSVSRKLPLCEKLIMQRLNIIRFVYHLCTEAFDRERKNEWYDPVQADPASRVSDIEIKWLKNWLEKMAASEARSRENKMNILLFSLSPDRAKFLNKLVKLSPKDPGSMTDISRFIDNWVTRYTFGDNDEKEGIVSFDFLARRIVPLWVWMITGHFPARQPEYITKDCEDIRRHMTAQAEKTVSNDEMRQKFKAAIAKTNYQEIYQNALWFFDHLHEATLNKDIGDDVKRDVMILFKKLQQKRQLNSPEFQNNTNIQRLVHLAREELPLLFKSEDVYSQIDQLYNKRLSANQTRLKMIYESIISKMRREELGALGNNSENGDSSGTNGNAQSQPGENLRQMRIIHDLITLIIAIKLGKNANERVDIFIKKYGVRPNQIKIFPHIVSKVGSFIDLAKDSTLFSPDLRRFLSFKDTVDRMIILELAASDPAGVKERFLNAFTRLESTPPWIQQLTQIMPGIFSEDRH